MAELEGDVLNQYIDRTLLKEIAIGHINSGPRAQGAVTTIFNAFGKALGLDKNSYTNSELLKLYNYALLKKWGFNLGRKKEGVIEIYLSKIGLEKERVEIWDKHRKKPPENLINESGL